VRRYKFLNRGSVFAALNKLRAAFLAARNGSDVDEIIKGILTHDERMKIGRRIQIAQFLEQGMQYREIMNNLKVGLPTIMQVSRKMDEYPQCFKLIIIREEKTKKDYRNKAFRKTGGSKLIFKRNKYTGFKRKDIKR
jgi:uncharacterized protein YerC